VGLVNHLKTLYRGSIALSFFIKIGNIYLVEMHISYQFPPNKKINISNSSPNPEFVAPLFARDYEGK